MLALMLCHTGWNLQVSARRLKMKQNIALETQFGLFKLMFNVYSVVDERTVTAGDLWTVLAHLLSKPSLLFQ